MNGRRVWWVVAASAALNLFLAGFVVAGSMRSRAAREPQNTGSMFRMGRVLGEVQDPELRTRIRSRMKQLRPEREALRNARGEVHEALRAEPFDASRLDQALATLRTNTDGVQTSMHSLLVEVAPRLSPEQRRRLAMVNQRRGRP